jgi:molybdopterin-guanine dinucleotide biosynthesis protein A
MGRDKAWLEVGGQSLLACQIGVVREFGAVEVFISGRADADYSGFGYRVLQDKFSDAGPLAGIERALDAAKSPLLLVLAVDLPEMNTEFLLRLVSVCSETCGAIPKLASHIEPLSAFYPKSSHSLTESLLRVEHNAVATFAEHCVQSGVARFMELSASETKYFTNWNSYTDLASVAANS